MHFEIGTDISMERQPRKFSTGLVKEVKPSDPESLFHDLRRSPAVPHLWAHQADILRIYNEKFILAHDVALELPTGAGKTLIGLLIAEYRRRQFDERVIYLCPTQQLVYQVGLHSKQYGIDVRTLLRPDYEGITDYYLNNAVGVTTYSSLFNVKPKITFPDAIVLDDAHSAEDYIAGMWSVSVPRQHVNNLYMELVELLRPTMEDFFAEYMLNDDPTPDILSKIDMLPLPRFWKYSGAIRTLLDSLLEEKENARYSWSTIGKSLHACCIFVTWQEILIRPVVPPSQTHEHFAHAKHRIYMSATLGEGGDLERTTGIPNIQRLKMSRELDKQNSGRRLFLFPNRSMDDEKAKQVTVAAVQESKRALILTPRTSDAVAIEERFLEAGIEVLTSRDIKKSLDAFTSQDNVVLVLANRYDGIDLPGESCRLLIIEGLPGGTNLQERFLLTRLAATSLLRDRIRTRITQGVGRCCRNSNDYCGVLIVGQRLLDFCARQEIRSGMHLDLQAEIEFGISNSQNIDSDGINDLLDLLFQQGEDWNAADQEIINIRDAIATNKSVQNDSDSLMVNLMSVAPHEVNFIYEMWRKDFISALNHAVNVADSLLSNEMFGYRAWWYYMAGCAAWLGGTEISDSQLIEKASEFFKRASRDTNSISWFAGLARSLDTGSNSSQVDIDSVRACESVTERLIKLGFTGSKFSNTMSDLTNLIQSNESDLFDRGLQTLGNYLGFDSGKPEGEAAPDAVWRFSNRLAVAFEAKKEELPSEPISMKTVRQALTHAQWVRNHRQMKDDAKLIVIVVTSRSSINSEAKQSAHDLYYLSPDKLRTLEASLSAALRRVRDRTTPIDTGAITKAIQEEFSSSHLLLTELISTLTERRLDTLPEV